MKNQSGSGCTQSIVWNAVPVNKNFKFSLFRVDYLFNSQEFDCSLHFCLTNTTRLAYNNEC